jgi:SecD/SecF fusion protein
MSLTQTLSRTFMTGLTTLFALTVLYLWGGEVIADFMFAILIGVLVGTYSSLFIAGPMLILFRLRPEMFGSEDEGKAVSRPAGAKA